MNGPFDDDRSPGSRAQPSPRSARRGKSVLAIRAMAGQTEWLDADPLWVDGRVVWYTARGPFIPTVADVALAQRRLNQIAGRPVSAQRAFGDAAAWLDRRRARLALAKHLQRLHEPDLPALVRRMAAGSEAAVASLVRLLVAEAYCLNDLPIRPSASLVVAGPWAEGAVRRALDDPDLPVLARALAALVLGAMRRFGAEAVAGPVFSPHERRAYTWGHTSGLPADAALIVTILADPHGAALARCYQATLDSANPFLLQAADLRRLIADPVSVSRAVAVAEAVPGAAPLAALITSYRDQLPLREDLRHAVAQGLSQERSAALATIRDLIHRYALQSADPGLVRTAVRFIDTMLHIGPVRRELLDAVAVELRQTLTLPSGLQQPALDLLVADHARLWPPDGYAGALEGKVLQPWLDHRHGRQARPLRELLRRTHAIDLTRAAFDLGIHETLAQHDWPDRALYRLALDLMRRFGMGCCWELCAFFDVVSSAARARAVLHPLTQALEEVALPLRALVFDAAMELVWADGVREVRDRLRRVSTYAASLVSFAQAQETSGQERAVPVREVLALDQEAPERARDWVEWLLRFLASDVDGKPPGHRDSPMAEQAVRLAAIVAHGDAALFQSVVRACLAHDYDYSWNVLEQSIAALRRYPRMHLPLAHLFAQQPQRCMAAVVHAGLAARLGPDVTAPLRRAEDVWTGEHAALSPDWQAVLACAPALAPWVGRYLAARDECGAGPAVAVPPALRKALDQPRRWAAEMDHLQRLIDANPGRLDLQVRLSNLRSRLADTAQVERSLRDEVTEHMQQLTAEALLAAVERTIQTCYLRYLDRVAGPIPPGLILSDDLLNALLLSADIRANRRLLLRLLRAYLAGDRRWPERHAANQRFLKRLAAAGRDARIWLSAHPRVYPCATAPGHRLHLSLERDPLRVLQMGNLFDTCLSFGGINAFSTVANACELNKRVLYIRDGKGRIVGRKLIGIADQGGLVGFRTYGGLPDEAGNAALKAVVRAYCERFAAACGLRLADEGTVPQLFVKDWYDDGVVPWDQDSPARPTRGSAGGDRSTLHGPAE